MAATWHIYHLPLTHTAPLALMHEKPARTACHVFSTAPRGVHFQCSSWSTKQACRLRGKKKRTKEKEKKTNEYDSMSVLQHTPGPDIARLNVTGLSERRACCSMQVFNTRSHTHACSWCYFSFRFVLLSNLLRVQCVQCRSKQKTTHRHRSPSC